METIIAFGIDLLLLLILFLIIKLFSKFVKFISLVFLFFLLLAGVYTLNLFNVCSYLDYVYYGVGAITGNFVESLGGIFFNVYAAFMNFIVYVLENFVTNMEPVKDFFFGENAYIFMLSWNGGLFVLSAIIFRKHKKIENKNSKYLY